jgi:4-hydroxybutyrate dehydrogenase
MKTFSVNSQICEYPVFADFAKEFEVGQGDLVFTHGFLYHDYMEPLNLGCDYLFQEDFGVGEPDDHMVDKVLDAIQGKNYRRIIGIGGGTVLDISKLLAIKDAKTTEDIFEDKIPLVRDKGLVLIPTTCGTGCEMTCVSVIGITKRQSKIGKRIEANFADYAVLIPELVSKLPFDVFAYSSIDALIHALEIYVAPTGNPFNDVFCAEAIRVILENYQAMAEKGLDERKNRMDSFLRASTYAGIALSNTVCGAVHASAMYYGARHHVAHGESNYCFLPAVFQAYARKAPDGKIKDIANIIKAAMGIETDTEGAFIAMEELLNTIKPRKKMRDYGTKEEDLPQYVDKVFETQQRLLVNNYVPLSKEELLEIYKVAY